ncbi:MAG TPA: hypothetical protein VEH84_06380 [Alphaproteobacteria bacterium]|nr:hypothetical protein [Alphaproteobacteria bacterium]
MKRLILIGLVALGTAACANRTERLTASADGITIGLEGNEIGDLTEATDRANVHCARTGRIAVLEGVSELDEQGSVARFNCAPR